ncbi:MAG: FliM/FliN family flagellar motor switch protein [Polyangiaceae bacterium]|nr:FliM/FliN family flagellar motor switch protein [Polyangiaceae bacterium]
MISTPQSPPKSRSGSSIRSVDLTGSHRHLRSSLSSMGKIAEQYSRATKRTLPFLLRQRTQYRVGEPSIGTFFDSESIQIGPCYMVELEDPAGSAWATLTLNGPCLGRLLEGSLGSSQISEGATLKQNLTLAQKVLIKKISEKLGGDLCDAIRRETQLVLEVSNSRALEDETEDSLRDGLFIELCLEGEAESPAAMILSMSAEALDNAVRQCEDAEPSRGDPRVAEALLGVQVALVAELGRLELGVGQLVNLKPGQVLRLPNLVDTPLSVRVGGLEKFCATPLTSRGQLSVQVLNRIGAPVPKGNISG